jgi:hypothetical protein
MEDLSKHIKGKEGIEFVNWIATAVNRNADICVLEDPS